MKKYAADIIGMLAYCLLVAPVFFYLAVTGGQFLASGHYVLGSLLLGLSLAVMGVGIVVTYRVYEIMKRKFSRDHRK